VPNVTVTAPKDGAEMLALLRLGVERGDGAFALRYPRDNVPAPVPALDDIARIEYGSWEILRRGSGVAVLAVGTMVLPALEVAASLEKEGISASVINCRFLKPHDEEVLAWAALNHHSLVTIEEGTLVNGFGACMARCVEPYRERNPELHVEVMGVPDTLIEHGTRAEQLVDAGLDPAAIAARIRRVADRSADAIGPVRESA
jgi:1-deoxy-D-xylulose-5-phosphate synthase